MGLYIPYCSFTGFNYSGPINCVEGCKTCWPRIEFFSKSSTHLWWGGLPYRAWIWTPNPLQSVCSLC